MSTKFTIEVNWDDGNEGREVLQTTLDFINEQTKEGYVEGELYQYDKGVGGDVRGYFTFSEEIILQPEKNG